MFTRLPHCALAQIGAFLEGFWELVPRHLIAIFNDHELELLISGLPDIDVADLRANTEYQGYTAASAPVQWFWEVVNEMEKEDLALLLQFVTGTSKVPLEGFKALQARTRLRLGSCAALCCCKQQTGCDSDLPPREVVNELDTRRCRCCCCSCWWYQHGLGGGRQGTCRRAHCDSTLASCCAVL